MAAKARASGVCTVVGLQAPREPRSAIREGARRRGRIGDVAACRVSLFREGSLQRGSDRAWQRDVTLGANTLTIAAGHTIDALRFALTEFSTISAIVATQSKSWLLTDKQEKVDVDAPDNVLINGMLDSGAVASAHIASIPWAGSGYRMEIYGTRGTLVATSADSPQLKEVRVQLGRAASRSRISPYHRIASMFPRRCPRASPITWGQLYERFGRGIREEAPVEPDFDTAVELHRLLDAIRESSATGTALTPRIRARM